MAILNINDKSYDIDKLSREARAQMQSIQFVDAEIARLTASLAVAQTARIAYLNALAPHLTAANEVKATLQ
ncbi:MAG: hypothetical protein IPN06_10220 [Burkholderiales bacterium]|nr:hypothetical protein [Burkholderiales bacterium]